MTTYHQKIVHPKTYTEPLTSTEVYYVIQAGVTRGELEFALGAVEQMPFMAALTSTADLTAGLPKDKELDDDLLRRLADRTECVMVGAYGGDANLIWSRE